MHESMWPQDIQEPGILYDVVDVVDHFQGNSMFFDHFRSSTTERRHCCSMYGKEQQEDGWMDGCFSSFPLIKFCRFNFAVILIIKKPLIFCKSLSKSILSNNLTTLNRLLASFPPQSRPPVRGLCKAGLGFSHQLRCFSGGRKLTFTSRAKTWTNF